MNQQDNGGHNEAKPISKLVITFEAPGSSEMAVTSENVTPAQILGVAAWLDWWARQMFDEIQSQKSANRIIIPGMNIRH